MPETSKQQKSTNDKAKELSETCENEKVSSAGQAAPGEGTRGGKEGADTSCKGTPPSGTEEGASKGASHAADVGKRDDIEEALICIICQEILHDCIRYLEHSIHPFMIVNPGLDAKGEPMAPGQ